MNSTRKRILTALWVAGAFAGLLAIIVLPGRWDRGGPAEAHTSPTSGVVIVETLAECVAHNLDIGTDEIQGITVTGAASGDFTLTYKGQTTGVIAYNATAGTVETALEGLSTIVAVTAAGGALNAAQVTVEFDDPGGQDVPALTIGKDNTNNTSVVLKTSTPGVQGNCVLPASANADAHPSNYLVDTTGDTVANAILAAAGDSVRVVAHVRTSTTADAANGTAVTWSATGASAIFQQVGRDSAPVDGALDATGDLSPVNAQTVGGETVSDTDAGTNGTCTATGDTCIDGATVQTGKKANPDGIAIAVVTSAVPTSSVITVTAAAGSDTITIIWTGPVTKIDVRANIDDATFDPIKTVAQSVIALTGDASDEKGGGGADNNGDPDLTITATARDSAQNPVSGAQIDCALDTAGGGRADIINAEAENDQLADDNVADPTGNIATGETTGTDGTVQMSLETETQAGSTRGDVIVTCWADTGATADVLDAGEANGSVTVRVSGPPAAVVITGNATMPLGTQILKATVTDADGEPVARETNCTWTLFQPTVIAQLTSPVSGGIEGTTDNSSSNTLVAGAAGTITVSVTCGTANTLMTITIGGVVFPPGDVDCDGSFTVADLLAAARALVGLDTALTAC